MIKIWSLKVKIALQQAPNWHTNRLCHAHVTRKNVTFSATQNVQEISHFLYISFSRIVPAASLQSWCGHSVENFASIVLVMIPMYSVGQLSSTISCTAEMWHVGNISCKVHYIWNVLYISCSTNIYYVLIFLLGYSPVPKAVNISDTSITTNVATYRHV